jgi:predicted O-linked N-acetylglucosamine transferase (SPINDLY family)
MSFADQFEHARSLLSQGHRESALQVCREIRTMKPTDAESLNQLGVLFGQLGDLDSAVGRFNEAITLEPTNSAPYCNRGLALLGLHQPENALISLDRAIDLDRQNTLAHYARGNVLADLDRRDDALRSYDEAIATNPSFPQAYFSRGNILQHMQRLNLALVDYDHAVRIKPDYAEAHGKRAFVLSQLRRFSEAISAYDLSICLNPSYAPTYLFRGNALKELRRFDAALESYDQAIALDPQFAEGHCNRGVLLQQMRDMEGALRSYDRAIGLNPGYADAYVNRASAFREVKRLEEAASDYDVAARLDSSIDFLPGLRLETRMHICDWKNFETEVPIVSALVERGVAASHPFALLACVDSAEVQKRAAETWVNNVCPPDDALGAIPKRQRTGKIRVGYFSPDFREHPVARLIGDVIETHDRSRFEIIAFSFGIGADDEIRNRLTKTFDQFHIVTDKSDLEVASLARSLQIDVAVDLAGYTHNCRPGIFALRAAPIQISYLGYLGTMGATYIDYLIADPMIVPFDQQLHYSERIIYLPSYQANDSRRIMSDRSFTRSQLGMPATGFAFSCFNSNFKITPAVFSVWMQVLRQVQKSILFLTIDNPSAKMNLLKEAQAHGVSAKQIIFGERLALPDYLARFRAMDLFLDTLPYNAGTTASDALWSGLPVLTCTGKTFAGRIATSLLQSIGLPELIAATPAVYQEIAIRLGSNPLQMLELKDKLSQNKGTQALFNTAVFTGHLETAYEVAIDRHASSLHSAHIHAGSDLA